ncbi:MAG: hypothetical protein IPL64_10840 [Flavobacteriales bacterium]|nr:hypothetical protein [Flavobacteriales bacterium]
MRLFAIAAMGIVSLAQAQVVVPFASPLDRLMVFQEGRFVEVDARPPKRSFPMKGALLYQDASGGLGYYTAESGKTRWLVREGVNDVQAVGDRAAWRLNDSLFVLRSGSAVRAATGVERFKVSDSLLVYVDSLKHELVVIHRNQRTAIATVEKGSLLPQWTQGGNTVTFYDRSQRKLSLFHHGKLRVLTEDADVGIAVNGMDIVGYWDDVRDEFMGLARTGEQRLSGLKPIDAKAGNGVLAFVDGTLKLKVWAGGEVVQLTDSMPAQFWVKDRVVLYLWGGKLMCWTSGKLIEVEPYVPEQWAVNDDLLVYLDINRELRGILAGERVRFGREANVDGFQLVGDAVLYRSPTGFTTVVYRGRSYTF